MTMRHLEWIFGTLWLAIAVMGGVAEAATRYVAKNGVDSPTCGTTASPCGSVSQAIDNAGPHDTIIVGPGRYDATSGIVVSKGVKILSSHGAAATLLDANGAAVETVSIEADKAVFGQPKKGFTITGSGGFYGGLFINTANGVRVAGNVARDNGPYASGFYVTSGTGHVLTGNAAWGNAGAGFAVGGSGNVVTGNSAWSNGGGCGGCAGFILSGADHVVTGNSAASNTESGFKVLDTGHVLRGNLATANGTYGFRFEAATGSVLAGNAASSNQEAGVFLVFGSATISGNNLYDNGIGAGATFPNCGLANQSGGAISAPNNFWGDAAGPGSDPADAACNSGGGSSTATDPPATKPLKVKVKPVF